MPIWIKYKNELILCDAFLVMKYDNCTIHAYTSCGGINTAIQIKNLTESEAQDLMRDITRAVASGERYFEIPERYIQNERT